MSVTLNTTTRRSTWSWSEVKSLLISRRHIEESKVQLHSILTNTLNGGERLTSRSSCFHRRRAPTTYFIGG